MAKHPMQLQAQRLAHILLLLSHLVLSPGSSLRHVGCSSTGWQGGCGWNHLWLAVSSARSSSSAGCVGWCRLPCTISLGCASGAALAPPAASAAVPAAVEVAASALPACTEALASCEAPCCSVVCLRGRCCCFCGVSAWLWLQPLAPDGDAASAPLPPLPIPPAAPPVADDGSGPWDTSCGVAASGTVARLCVSTLAMPAPAHEGDSPVTRCLTLATNPQTRSLQALLFRPACHKQSGRLCSTHSAPRR
jgi:hypothetical protein